MKTALIIAALIAAFASASVFAQSLTTITSSSVNAEPPQGATIQHVFTRPHGWAGIVIAEQIAELQQCRGSGVLYGAFLGNSKILWVSTADAAGKQLYNSLLAAFYAAKKLSQVIFNVQSSECYLALIRVGP